jgi:hypothetical protein
MRVAILAVASLWAAWMVTSPASAQEPVPTATPEPLGSIRVELDIDGIDDNRLSFDFDKGNDFSLRDGGGVDREGLDEDEYTIQLRAPSYRVSDIECSGIDPRRVERSESRGRAVIDLDGEHVTCVFEVERIPDATATPKPAATVTPATPVPAVVTQPTIIVVEVPAPALPTIGPVAPNNIIRPPSTGDGGLL